ncbi:DUF2721 domain-containing protein [Oxalicibacterium solurbis]|uniref:DUF2721 domain-containing protein n=1 Tax=Oxalicibacterium solurbis TaxID=69280 RepID=A0A8J3AYD9_9BURK|nr:DUF2721 domain-containing protein [Oxalicibacterium solurbis]GGI53307.1 hypothetical protein GCM10011430_04810 [Oxalicibacterium solurbis]
MQIELNDIGHIIQLSVAPVFLLTGVGTTLTVLTNRLARIVDRSRILEDKFRKEEDEAHAGDYRDELITLYSRSHLINRAIVLATACALMISLVIISLFVGDALNIDLSKYIAAFFVLAMVSLLASFSYLLREIFLATQTMRTVVRLPK